MARKEVLKRTFCFRPRPTLKGGRIHTFTNNSLMSLNGQLLNPKEWALAHSGQLPFPIPMAIGKNRTKKAPSAFAKGALDTISFYC
jgi:hypothetical protein